ncbi:MAG: oxidation resistance protein 1 [Pycnora praestabilis]|nr:MAG: oxidation resistance protein 1 [Pycnora praestabilis]
MSSTTRSLSSSSSSSSPPPQNHSPSSPAYHDLHARSSYFSFPINYAVSGILRRLDAAVSNETSPSSTEANPALINMLTPPLAPAMMNNTSSSNGNGNGVYTPPLRRPSPFQPPPLTPLRLVGVRETTAMSARILSRALAEEIRLLVPPRLQLVDEWRLAYSVEQDGTSLSTLYDRCEAYRGKRSGFVLVVRDGGRGIFGAYLTDPPRPTPHFYGTGECFLWRASLLPTLSNLLSSSTTILSNLPPPPSADTTNLQRSTTISAGPRRMSEKASTSTLSPPASSTMSRNGSGTGSGGSGTSTPERIRFKAFPYSGVNDYMILCEQEYLSVGGG